MATAARLLADACLRLPVDDRDRLRCVLRAAHHGRLGALWGALADFVDVTEEAEEMRLLNAATSGELVARSTTVEALTVSAAPVFAALDALALPEMVVLRGLGLTDGAGPLRDVWAALASHAAGVA